MVLCNLNHLIYDFIVYFYEINENTRIMTNVCFFFLFNELDKIKQYI